MPIRINLLAEAQALEEQRRRDPVKRATVGAVCLVSGVLVWGGAMQYKIMAAKAEVKTLGAQWSSLEKEYSEAVGHKRQGLDANEKLSALQNYTTNRMLWGTALNGLQQSLEGIDDVKLIRLKVEQGYSLTEETKARTNGNVTIPGRPATATEKIVLQVEAIDASPQPGSQISRFKHAITSVPYFQEHLQKTNGVLLTSLSAPTAGGLARTPYVMFTLQCFFPEQTR